MWTKLFRETAGGQAVAGDSGRKAVSPEKPRQQFSELRFVFHDQYFWLFGPRFTHGVWFLAGKGLFAGTDWCPIMI
jgi:hypothetical protein